MEPVHASCEIAGEHGQEGEQASWSDTELLRRFVGGDREALSAIIARHDVAIRGVLLGLWDDRHEVDDFCQEVFLRLIQRPPLLSGGNSLRPWLYRTALNVVRDRARRHRLRRLPHLGTVGDPRPRPKLACKAQP